MADQKQKVEYADLDTVIYDLGGGKKQSVARSEISPQSKIHVDGQTWINEQKAKKDADMRTMINDPKVPAAGAWTGPTASDIGNALTPSYSGNTPVSTWDDQGNIIAEHKGAPATVLPPAVVDPDMQAAIPTEMDEIDPKTGKPKWMSQYKVGLGDKPNPNGPGGVGMPGGSYRGGSGELDAVNKQLGGIQTDLATGLAQTDTRQLEQGIERDQNIEELKVKKEELDNVVKNFDPGEIGMWTNKSAGQKVTGAIAIAMGAIGDAMMQIGGAKGPGNMALQVIMEGVDQEVERQKEIANNKKFAATEAGKMLTEANRLGISQDQLWISVKQNKINQAQMMMTAAQSKASNIKAKEQIQQGIEGLQVKWQTLEVKKMGMLMKGSGTKNAFKGRLEMGSGSMTRGLKKLYSLSGVKKDKETGEYVSGAPEYLSNYLVQWLEGKIPKQMESDKFRRTNLAMSNIARGYAQINNMRGEITPDKIRAWINSEYFPQKNYSATAVMDILEEFEAANEEAKRISGGNWSDENSSNEDLFVKK